MSKIENKIKYFDVDLHAIRTCAFVALVIT